MSSPFRDRHPTHDQLADVLRNARIARDAREARDAHNGRDAGNGRNARDAPDKNDRDVNDDNVNDSEREPMAAAVVQHVLVCDRCRAVMRDLERLAALTTLAHSAPRASTAAREAILLARRRGDRGILPTEPEHVAHAPSLRRARWHRVLAVAAALAVVSVPALLRAPREIVAGTTAGTLTLSTTHPKPGEVVSLEYRAGPMLDRAPALRVRARVRTATDDSYEAGASGIIELAVLARGGDGVWRATFTLSDSIVYAALAIEDTAGREIDDHDGRTWEVLQADSAGHVRYEAMDQRINDLMGRNWEEGQATARRLVDSFPDDIRAWSWLRTFDSWAGVSEDSINARFGERFLELERRQDARPESDPVVLGYLFWTADRSSTRRSALRERLLREAPTNSFAVQERLMETLGALERSRDTTAAIQALDTLFAEAPTDRRAQVAGYTFSLAMTTGDTSLIRRWSARVFDHGVGGRRRLGTAFVQHAELRADGLDTLRAVLRDLAFAASLPRRLSERADAHARRLDLERRRTLAALGRALTVTGDAAAALDTLARAADGWDVPVMQAVASAAKAVGDTLLEARMNARLALDPASPTHVRDSLTRQLSARADWPTLRAEAESAFVVGVLNDARPRMIARPAKLQTLDGRPSDLRAIARTQVTVVAVLSRFCVPAIEALPALREMAAALASEGIATHVVFEESTASDELRAFVREHALSMPIHIDPLQEGAQVLNNWGTPMFYVLDGRGAIVFDATSEPADATRRALAVRRADARGISPPDAP